MPHEPQIIFPSPKRQVLFLILLLPAFVIAVFVFVNGYNIWVRDFYFRAVARADLSADLWISARVFRLSIFAMLGFGGAILALLWRLLRPRPSLILRADGFTSNLAPKGTVSWDNVAAISVRKYRGARNLVVALHDEARFLAENRLKRGPTFRGNMAMFKAPIVIPQMRLSEKAEDIAALMQNLQAGAAQ